MRCGHQIITKNDLEIGTEFLNPYDCAQKLTVIQLFEEHLMAVDMERDELWERIYYDEVDAVFSSKPDPVMLYRAILLNVNAEQ